MSLLLGSQILRLHGTIIATTFSDYKVRVCASEIISVATESIIILTGCITGYVIMELYSHIIMSIVNGIAFQPIPITSA